MQWVGLTFALTLAGCVPATTDYAPREPDPTYFAPAALAQFFADSPDCTPEISPATQIVTLLAEPGSCPTAWYDDTPFPCLQIETAEGLRVPMQDGLVGLGAAGSPERRVRVARLIYPDGGACIPQDAIVPGLIYIGPV